MNYGNNGDVFFAVDVLVTVLVCIAILKIM